MPCCTAISNCGWARPTLADRRYAIALVRDPRFGTYTLPADSLGMTLYQLMIDRDGDGVFLTRTDYHGQHCRLWRTKFSRVNEALL